MKALALVCLIAFSAELALTMTRVPTPAPTPPPTPIRVDEAQP